ncbi:uncharacterized protein LOC129232770 [Uloborus diversus]|uniref:uncharacterized protein LOC129220830 n=1 Tax=Uloborus diversus TaxID=327109 RepID=UPI00240A135F|nr:uncharacterized protein LOC129220830 [Uloborus diversus]XP_054722848.1 uncharacterized protein LOC129232770 [Uloborus diversus]
MPIGNKRTLDEASSNYAEELRDSDDDVIGEDTQSFAEASEVFKVNNQNGSGFENTPGPSHAEPEFDEREIDDAQDMEAALQMELIQGRWIEKYKASQKTFRAKVDLEKLPEELRGKPLVAAISSVRELFRMIIRRASEDLRPTDLIRIYIQADGLDKPISTRLMPVSDLTLETVMAAILKVLQSKDEIALDSGFSADVVTIRRDVGAGRRRMLNPDVDCLNKRSVITIPTDSEGLCCAMAIVCALAHLDNDRTAIESFKKRNRLTLLNRAKELHAASGVPLGPCTYAEIAEFEKHLGVQIAVISTEEMNKVYFYSFMLTFPY